MNRHRTPTDPKPLWRQAIAQWPDEYQFEFEEQAAIKEFLDNRPRELAEREAFEEVSDRYMKAKMKGVRHG